MSLEKKHPSIYLAQLLDAPNGTPVKFHTAANTVDTRTDDHDVWFMENQVMLSAIVAEIQIVGLGWPFCGHRVNLFHHW